MTQAMPERRTMRRFEMRLPAAVKLAGNNTGEVVTETYNVSARGVFFYLDRALAIGDSIDVTLTFPPHVTLTEKVRVRFSARVVRVERGRPDGGIGIAAAIEGYEFLRNHPFEDLEESPEPEWN
jgi:hypothetical protein